MLKSYNYDLWSDIPEKDYLNIKSLYVKEKYRINYNILRKLTNLEELHLTHNLLSSFDGSELVGLINLKVLDLVNNRLTSFDGSKLIKLKNLYLMFNFLSSFDGTGLINLETLLLDSNKLTSFDGSGLNSLINLDLRNNKLKSFNKTRLNNLEMILIYNNEFLEPVYYGRYFPSLNEMIELNGEKQYLKTCPKCNKLTYNFINIKEQVLLMQKYSNSTCC